MNLRLATKEEFEAIRSFYWDLIDEMMDQNDVIGWKKGIYPTDEFLSESIRNGELYVLDADNGNSARVYSACVIVNSAYNEGYNGCPWKVNCEPSEILIPHALGVDPRVQGKGIGKIVVHDIIEMAQASGKKAVRLDILGGNVAAERLYTAMGFQYVEAKNMFYEDTGWTTYVMYELDLKKK